VAFSLWLGTFFKGNFHLSGSLSKSPFDRLIARYLQGYPTLRANTSETIEWLKFTLEGVGERTHGYAFEDTAF